MPNAQPERQAAVAVLRWLRLVLPVGSLVAAVRNEEQPRSQEPRARARFHAARKAAGVLVGFPDLVAVMPGSRVLFVEMKAPGSGVLSLTQQGLHERFRTLGHPVVTATSIETARHGLQALGVPLREDPAQIAIPARVRKAKAWPVSQAVELP